MSAKDYHICPALFNAYIAKVSKRSPNMMTSDRREITESEILSLIDWYLDKELDELKAKEDDFLWFASKSREGYYVKMTFEKIEEGE